MPSWWCENAWLPPGRVAARVLVTVADGRITGVEDGRRRSVNRAAVERDW